MRRSLMKRLWLTVAVVLAVLAVPSGALGAGARQISPTALAFPAAFTLTPDGSRILYGERYTGRISWLNPTTGARTPFFTVPNVAATGDQGLLGLALHPSYPADGRVWAFVTRLVAGVPRNQLLRINANGSGFSVVRTLATSASRDGGRILFGPDGKLYVTIGDNANPALAQNLNSQAGKVLRFNFDGTVPVDNPRAGSPAIAYGFRNSFGFTFDPQSGRLWATDNGPHCNDEINLVPRLTLTNFGWGPSQSCSTPPLAPRNTNRDGPNPVLPRLFFESPPALTGAAFCDACGLTGAGNLFFGAYVNGTIYRARLAPDRRSIASYAPFYDHPGGVISVETPLRGGPIYFSSRTNVYRLRP
jgi:glucose/arabinose dehydrogenase